MNDQRNGDTDPRFQPPDPERYLDLEQRLRALADLLEKYRSVREEFLETGKNLDQAAGAIEQAAEEGRRLNDTLRELGEAIRSLHPEQLLVEITAVGRKLQQFEETASDDLRQLRRWATHGLVLSYLSLGGLAFLATVALWLLVTH